MASGIDVSIEHRGNRSDDVGRQASQHVPEAAVRTTATTSSRPTCGFAPTAATTSRCGRATRIAQLTDGGTFVEHDAGAAFGRPARVLRPEGLYRADCGGRGGDRARGRHRRRRGGDRATPVRARRHGFRLHGRLDGERGRREDRPRVQSVRRSDAFRSSASRPRAAPGCRKGSWRSCSSRRRSARSTSCARPRRRSSSS